MIPTTASDTVSCFNDAHQRLQLRAELREQQQVNGPEFDPLIDRHDFIGGVAASAVLMTTGAAPNALLDNDDFGGRRS